MKKGLAIFLLLISSLSAFAQIDTFYRYSHYGISGSLEKYMDSYVKVGGKKLERNSIVDSLAKARANYFLDVIQINSESGKDFSTMLDSIPNNKKAHTSVFGNPGYFTEPKSEYPYLFKFFPCLNLEAKSEIMHERVKEIKSYTRISPKDAIEIADKYFSEYCAKNFYPLKNSTIERGSQKIGWDILNEYKNSESHDKAIKKWGNGQFGISTRILVHEKKVGDLWVYEVMYYNVVVFTGKI